MFGVAHVNVNSAEKEADAKCFDGVGEEKLASSVDEFPRTRIECEDLVGTRAGVGDGHAKVAVVIMRRYIS